MCSTSYTYSTHATKLELRYIGHVTQHEGKVLSIHSKCGWPKCPDTAKSVLWVLLCKHFSTASSKSEKYKFANIFIRFLTWTVAKDWYIWEVTFTFLEVTFTFLEVTFTFYCFIMANMLNLKTFANMLPYLGSIELVLIAGKVFSLESEKFPIWSLHPNFPIVQAVLISKWKALLYCNLPKMCPLAKNSITFYHLTPICLLGFLQLCCHFFNKKNKNKKGIKFAFWM